MKHGALSDETRAKISAANLAAWERRRRNAPKLLERGYRDERALASIAVREHRAKREPPDALAVPCSRRDQLAMFADLATVLAENPTMLPGDAVDLVWQRWTVRYRTPEQPTREG